LATPWAKAALDRDKRASIPTDVRFMIASWRWLRLAGDRARAEAGPLQANQIGGFAIAAMDAVSPFGEDVGTSQSKAPMISVNRSS
jgi:hypothetical protein